MNRDEFIRLHPIDQECERRGIKLIGVGDQKTAVCPFHKDKKPSMSVNVRTQVWNCHVGCGKGSVLDLISLLDGKTIGELLNNGDGLRPLVPEKPNPPSPPPAEQPKYVIAKTYPYHDALGNEIYQVVRLEPKSFRQRHRGPDGAWVWNMEGVVRVLYRLTEILLNETIAIAEGEKDAQSLVAIGFCGTCNVGGAGKWMDGYTETLAGKDVLIFGDNDEPGRKHVDLIFESIAGRARTVRLVPVPKTFKDVSDYISSFQSTGEARKAIDDLISDCHPFVQGTKLAVYTMAEIEPRYEKLVQQATTESFNLGSWLPSFNQIRRLMPGELVLLAASTGTGKTALLSSIAIAAKPLPTLMFEFELPSELLFERHVAAVSNLPCRTVEETYAAGETLGTAALNHHFHHLLICPEPKLTPEQIESIIIRSELKMGVRPKVVLIDYVQLAQGSGKSRYEKASSVAEDLKIVAKSTRTIIIMASQIGRPKDDDDPEVGLHDAKESGSMENSAGLVLGAWRDPDDRTLLWLKVLKCTKGRSGLKIACNFDGEKMIITERSQMPDFNV